MVGFMVTVPAWAAFVNGCIKTRINGAGYLQASIPQDAAEWRAAV
jgi:hypothetical protein